MAKLGALSTFDIVATLAGAAGSFEGIPAIEILPSEIVTSMAVADDNLSFSVDWAAEGDFTINVTVDNLGGLEAVGTLTGSVSGTVAPADVVPPTVLADALAVKERV